MTLRGAVKATVVSTTSRAKQRAAGEGNNRLHKNLFLIFGEDDKYMKKNDNNNCQ